MVSTKLAAGEVWRCSCSRPCCPPRAVVSSRVHGRHPDGQRGFSDGCGFVASLAEAGGRIECIAADRLEVCPVCAPSCLALRYW
jgi:hypothetical protein